MAVLTLASIGALLILQRGEVSEMNFTDCFNNSESILMEGALGERLKREYDLKFDDNVVMAGLVYTEEGRNALNELWTEYADIAYKYDLPFLAATTTRRANKERVSMSRYDRNIIHDNAAFLRSVQSRQKANMYVGGLMGCYGDAYTGERPLGKDESREFHAWEAEAFAEAGVDFIYAALLPNAEEALGISLAIEKYKVPYIISFTIKRDGRLIDGTSISDAVKMIDGAVKFAPVCYMTNCVHPSIAKEALTQPFNDNEIVRSRFAGIQANTSALSYEELEMSKDLKASDPVLLAEEMMKLREQSRIKIFGGCCGTDGRHMEEIAKRIV